MNTPTYKHQITPFETPFQIMESQPPRIFVESWKNAPRGAWATLSAGDDYVDSGYAGSEFVIHDRTERMPVNIKLTGRGCNYKLCSGSRFVRCEIEFVKDCEENVFLRGAYVEVEMV